MKIRRPALEIRFQLVEDSKDTRKYVLSRPALAPDRPFFIATRKRQTGLSLILGSIFDPR